MTEKNNLSEGLGVASPITSADPAGAQTPFGARAGFYEEMAKYVRELKIKYKFATEFRENEIVIVVGNSWISLRFDEQDKHLVRFKVALEDIAMFECTPTYILYTNLASEEVVGASFKPTPNSEDIILTRDIKEAKEFVEELIRLLREEKVQEANKYLRELAEIYENALESEEA